MIHPEFSEGICQDGAAILRDGQPLTISEILASLRQGAEAQKRIRALEAALKWLLWLHNDDLHGTTPVASETEWDEAWETAAELVKEPPR